MDWATLNQSSVPSALYSNGRAQVERQLDLQCTVSIPIVPETTSDGLVLVAWYTTDDPENPQNWSKAKKYFIVLVLCLYT